MLKNWKISHLEFNSPFYKKKIDFETRKLALNQATKYDKAEIFQETLNRGRKCRDIFN